MDKLQEYQTALVRLDELSLMLGETLRLTRVGWDCIEGEKSDEAILDPINQIAKQIGEAMPEDIKRTRPNLVSRKCEQCEKLREVIRYHTGRAFELFGEGCGAATLAELDMLLTIQGYD